MCDMWYAARNGNRLPRWLQQQLYNNNNAGNKFHFVQQEINAGAPNQNAITTHTQPQGTDTCTCIGMLLACASSLALALAHEIALSRPAKWRPMYTVHKFEVRWDIFVVVVSCPRNCLGCWLPLNIQLYCKYVQ